MRPSEQLARLRAEVIDLENYCAILKAALMAATIPIPDAAHSYRMRSLTPQGSAVLGLLLASYPRAVDRVDLLERIPCQDRWDDPLDRQVTLVAVIVCQIRRALGADAIENIWGFGYRLSDRLHADLKADPALLVAC